MTNHFRTVKVSSYTRRLCETMCLSFGSCQVFTWYGATIEMDGVTETDYTAGEVKVLVSFSTLPLELKIDF